MWFETLNEAWPSIGDSAWNSARRTGFHAAITFPGGFRLELDQHEFAKQWNSGTPELGGGSVVLCLSVPARDDVDQLWQRMVDSGHTPRQEPYDTFWGSRFAIVDDPDGYQIGLMSPVDADKRYWPPINAPTASTAPPSDHGEGDRE